MMEPEKKEIGIITYCVVKEWGEKKSRLFQLLWDQNDDLYIIFSLAMVLVGYIDEASTFLRLVTHVSSPVIPSCLQTDTPQKAYLKGVHNPSAYTNSFKTPILLLGIIFAGLFLT